MFIITLQTYPHWKRCMRGSVLKEMSVKEIVKIHWIEELEKIVKHWCSERFDIHIDEIYVKHLFSLSSDRSEKRMEEFFHSLRIYDVRIVHIRLHKRYDPSLVKLKISFKRQGHRYHDTLKILANIVI